MAIRNGGQGQRIEVLPADELPKPIGRKLRRGGAMKIQLARGLTIKVPNDLWQPYLDLAEQFRRHQCRELAMQAGGRCGAAPSSMIASAAMQLAMSRYMFDKGAAEGDMGMVKMASGIMNDSRQNLLAAYELAIREAKARADWEQSDPHRALTEALKE